MPMRVMGADGNPILAKWAKGAIIASAIVLAFALGWICGQGSSSDDSVPAKSADEPKRKAANNQLGS